MRHEMECAGGRHAGAHGGCAGRTEAGIIIGNYPTTGDGNVIDMEEHSVGAGWTMPAGTAYTLTSATFRLVQDGPTGSNKVELFGDSGGNPAGPVLDTFTTPVLGEAFQDVTVTPLPRSPCSPACRTGSW